MQKNKKLNDITLIQVIATGLIVFSHSVASSILYPDATGTAVAVIQNAGLVAFMWCAGFLMARTDAIKKYGYKRYIAKRFIRLMIPFFVIQLLMLFPKILIAKMIGQPAELSLPALIHSFLYPREGILPHLWFLPTLMLLCVISPVLQRAAENKARWIIALAVAAGLAYFPLNTNFICLGDVKNYLFWYLLGIGCAMPRRIDTLKNISAKFTWVMLPIILAGWIVLITFAGHSCKFLSGLLSLFLLITASSKFAGDGIQHIGRYTFPIYILSLPIQNIVEIFAGRFGMGWPAATAVMFAAGVLIPLIMALCVNKFEEKNNLKIISRCIGL